MDRVENIKNYLDENIGGIDHDDAVYIIALLSEKDDQLKFFATQTESLLYGMGEKDADIKRLREVAKGLLALCRNAGIGHDNKLESGIIDKAISVLEGGSHD